MDRPLLKQAVENRAWIPNLLTLIRFLGGIVLIFLPIPGKAFYTVYILCGLTDALDGFLARRLRTASPFAPSPLPQSCRITARAFRMVQPKRDRLLIRHPNRREKSCSHSRFTTYRLFSSSTPLRMESPYTVIFMRSPSCLIVY